MEAIVGIESLQRDLDTEIAPYRNTVAVGGAPKVIHRRVTVVPTAGHLTWRRRRLEKYD